MKKKLELLAPVGGLQQLFAAVENGADGVYLGGPFFNARMKAENFTMEDLRLAVQYAHSRNVKVYSTLNTLLYDDELDKAVRYAGELYSLGIDALIVQDFGLADLLRKYLPQLPLHLSTQGTVYNPSGVKQAKAMGFQRVVLARETSLSEIREITDTIPDMEIEIFVHGALCMAYSGQCQLSRFLGGRSGNRGLCAQPCRLPYEGKSGKSYPLSPKDLCSLDFLKEIREAGVHTLKIEGRMKSPEYVAVVTAIYRKYLDQLEESGKICVTDEDRTRLRQIFSRGEFTTGYLKGNPGEELLSGDLPKHHGLLVGTVEKRISPQLLQIKLQPGEDISMGDGVEIRGKELAGNVVTYRKDLGNRLLQIGDIKGTVGPGDAIYRITDKSQLEDARSSYAQAALTEGKSHRRIPLEMEFYCRLGEVPILRIREPERDGSAPWLEMQGDQPAEPARTKSLSREMVEEQLSKTGDTPFRLEGIRIELEEGLSLPLSALNGLRRKALDAWMEKKTRVPGAVTLPDPLNIGEVNPKYPTEAEERDMLELYGFSPENFQQPELLSWLDQMSLGGLLPQEIRCILPLTMWDQVPSLQEELKIHPFFSRERDHTRWVPFIPNISKGLADTLLVGRLTHFIDLAKKAEGVYIGNLGWLKEFLDAGIPVYGDYGLNLNNRAAFHWASKIGLKNCVPSLESVDGPEDWGRRYLGSIPLMTTEHPLDAELFEARKGVHLVSRYSQELEKTLVTRPMEKAGSWISRMPDMKKRKTRIFLPL